MKNPDGNNAEKWLKKIGEFVKRLGQSINSRLQRIFTKENAARTKEKALLWEQKTHKRINQSKTSLRKMKHKLDTETNMKPLLSKGAFGLNVFFGVIRNIFTGIILLMVLLGMFGGGVGLGYFANLISKETAPTYESMAEDIGNVELVSTMYYANSEAISEIRTDLVRTTVGSENISPLIKEALIATEDENFYEHNGIVPVSYTHLTLPTSDLV